MAFKYLSDSLIEEYYSDNDDSIKPGKNTKLSDKYYTKETTFITYEKH